MKITIDKASILLCEKDDAIEMARSEAEWIDADVLKYCAREILENYYGNSVYIETVITLPRLKVCKNHYKLTVYAENMLIKARVAGEDCRIINMGFDVIATYNEGDRGAFIETYKSEGYRVI